MQTGLLGQDADCRPIRDLDTRITSVGDYQLTGVVLDVPGGVCRGGREKIFILTRKIEGGTTQELVPVEEIATEEVARIFRPILQRHTPRIPRDIGEHARLYSAMLAQL